MLLEELLKDERKEGIKEGIQKGRQKGLQEGQVKNGYGNASDDLTQIWTITKQPFKNFTRTGRYRNTKKMDADSINCPVTG